MNKNTYIQPSIRVIECESSYLLNDSIGIDKDNPFSNEGDVESKSRFFDDDSSSESLF